MKKALIFGGIGLIFIVIIILLLGAGGKKKEIEKTLTVWTPFEEEDALNDLSAQFREDNPNVKVKFKYIEADDAKDYEAKVVNEIANGQGPDIWLVRSDWLPKHVNKLTPFTQTAKKMNSVELAKSLIEPSLVEINSYQGQVYGWPLFADSLALIINRDMYRNIIKDFDFDKAAQYDLSKLKNWEDLKNFVQTFSVVKNNKIERSALAMGTTNNIYAPVDLLSAFLVQKQVQIMNEDLTLVRFNEARTKGAVNSYPSTEALDFYTSFARAGSPHYSWSKDMGDPIQAFLQGKTMMIFGYHSTLRDILKQKPSFEVVLRPMPQLDEDKRIDFAVSWSFVVNSGSLLKNEAWTFLRAITDKRSNELYRKKTNRLSALADYEISVPSGITTYDSPNDLFRSQIQVSKGLVKPEWQTVDETLQDAINQIIFDNQTPQNAVDNATARFKKAFEK